MEDNEILTDINVSRILTESRKRNFIFYLAFKSMIQMRLRVTEIKFIKVESLNMGYIVIFNKGGERKVPLPPDLIKDILPIKWTKHFVKT